MYADAGTTVPLCVSVVESMRDSARLGAKSVKCGVCQRLDLE
jgi:hypothetical protein